MEHDLLKLLPSLGSAGARELATSTVPDLDGTQSLHAIEKLCDFLLANGAYCQGVLRVSGSSTATAALCVLLRMRPALVTDRVLHAAGYQVVGDALKTVVRSRREPIVAHVASAAPACTARSIVDSVREPLAAKALHCLMHMAHALLPYERTTSMNAEAFAVCLAPAICSDVLSGLDIRAAMETSLRINAAFAELIGDAQYAHYFPHPYKRMSAHTALAARDSSLLLRESEWLDLFLSTGGVRAKLNAGAVLIEAGACNRTLYRVISGKFEVRAGTVLKYGSAGAIFGEMALFSVDSTAVAQVKCVEDAEVWAISSASIADVCRVSPLLASRVFANIASTLATRLYVTLSDWHAAAQEEPVARTAPPALERASTSSSFSRRVFRAKWKGLWGSLVVDTQAGIAKFTGVILGFTRVLEVKHDELRDVRTVDDKTLLIVAAAGNHKLLLQSASDLSKARDALALLRKDVQALAGLTLEPAPPAAANELFVAHAQQRSHASDDLQLEPGERVLITGRKGSLVFAETLDREGVAENGWCHADTFAVGHTLFFGTFGMDTLLESAQEISLAAGDELRLNGDLFVVLDGQLEMRVGHFRTTLYADAICGETVFLLGGLPLVSISATTHGATVARLETDRVLAYIADPEAALGFYTFVSNVLRTRLHLAQARMSDV